MGFVNFTSWCTPTFEIFVPDFRLPFSPKRISKVNVDQTRLTVLDVGRPRFRMFQRCHGGNPIERHNKYTNKPKVNRFLLTSPSPVIGIKFTGNK